MTLHIYEDIQQRSEEWHNLRCGKITASAIGQLVTTKSPDALEVPCDCGATVGLPCINKRNGQPMATLHASRTSEAKSLPSVLTVVDMRSEVARKLAGSLASERIDGIDPDNELGGRDIWRGIDSEDPAREAYSAHYGVEVTDCGFMELATDSFRLGVSPDGLVGDDGGIEIKAPRKRGHVLTAAAGVVPAEHMAQIQTALFVSGRKWWDFVSFHGGMRLWVKRVFPDPDWHRAIEAAATDFEKAVQQMVNDYNTAVEGFPMTDRLPDWNEVELKL